MKKIYVRSPKGNLGLEFGDTDSYTTAGLIQLVAKVFGYNSILSGVDQGQLIDYSETPLHQKAEVPEGEYELRLII